MYTYTKDNTKPLQGDIVSTIIDKIDSGIGVLNFLGHGTTQNWDVAIDDPTKYNNKNKYPFIVSNGCQTGDFGKPGNTIGETFLKTPEKGGVIYLGGSATTWLGVVDNYVDSLYIHLFNDTANVSMGDAIQGVLKNYLLGIPAEYTQVFRNHAKYVSLQGDPSLTLELPTRPDFTLSNTDISLLPNNVTVQADSFIVQAVIHNQARAYKNDIQYRLKIGGKVVKEGVYTGDLFYSDTLKIWVKNENLNLQDYTEFCVKLDHNSLITETDEANNEACNTLYIPKNKALPIYPRKYEIVSQQAVKLVATAENLYTQKDLLFTFEVDTVADFNSTFKKTYTDIKSNRHQVELGIPFTMSDSTAYFWRVKLNSGSAQDIWAYSNFTFIQNSPKGIAQVHLQQYKDGSKDLLEINNQEKIWQFSPNSTTIDIITNSGYNVNGAVGLDVNCCCLGPNTGLFIAVMHPTGLVPWLNPYGGGDCGANGGFFFNSPSYCFNESGKGKIKSFLNSIPEGHLVFAWKTPTANIDISTFDEQTFAAFENIGSANIRNFAANEPIVIFGKKGAVLGTALEKGYDPTSSVPINQQVASLRVVYNGFWYEGNYIYENIGPASSWSSLHWNTNTKRLDNTGDTLTYNIYGVKLDGTSTLLMNNVKTYQNTSLSGINATTYPYLRLKAHFKDTLFRTAPQLRHNMVFYQGVGDLTVAPETWSSSFTDTLDNQASINTSIRLRNVSPYAVGGVTVNHYWVNISTGIRTLIKTENVSGLNLNDSTTLSATQTLNGTMEGEYDYMVDVNPNRNPLELYYHNNVYKKRVYLKENIKPILAVTFDTQTITDKQQVSPNTVIDIRLQDNSTKYFLNDTTYITQVNLTNPRKETQQIYFNTTHPQHLTFSGGSASNGNLAKLQLVHDSLPDGYYTLSIEAKDYSNNKVSYQVVFGVFKQESGITQVMVSPNPFTDKTKFSFVIQGAIVPDEVYIDIVDVAGRRVKRIYCYNLQLGQNQAEYWEGTTDNQVQASSGVYFYRMTAKYQGKEMKSIASGADAFLNGKGYGKLIYLK